MSYAFEDYDAFLASFSDRDNLQHNPSLSTTLSTEDDPVVFGSVYPEMGVNTQAPQNTILSPDYTSASASSSPNELQRLSAVDATTNGNGFTDFDFNNDNFGMNPLVKQESFSASASSSASPTSYPAYPTKPVRLADAVPHGGSVSKRGAKKEKSSHNMIEKRYRTNINDKIKALRDSVPALRVLVESGEEDFDDLDGLQPAKKLNKATILSKATEYIKHLEAKNDSLKRENDQLKARLYGGQVTPGSSVSSYSSERGGMSLGNKVLLGGLACMVGSGLSDDLNSPDTRSLFSLPVFGYDAAGFQMMTKPLILLLKISFVFAVVLNFIFPSLFYSKKPSDKKQAQSSAIYDDVRQLTVKSVWSTFSLKKGHSNNDYVKAGIFRCLLLKARYFHANVLVKSLVNAYVNHLWYYLQTIQLDSSAGDYAQIKTILSLDTDNSIHNEDYISKFIKQDVSMLAQEGNDGETDYSAVSILYRMINENRTNLFLRKFMTETVTTDRTIPEIESGLETDEHNVELTTLFKPDDAQIEKFKMALESWNLSEIRQDDVLVLYSAIIQNLVFEKKDYDSAKIWFSKIQVSEWTDFTLLGFTSLYIVVRSMINHPNTYANDKDVIFKLEEISAILRIWLGNANGSVLSFKKRSQLIDFFVGVSLKINGMDEARGMTENEVVSA